MQAPTTTNVPHETSHGNLLHQLSFAKPKATSQTAATVIAGFVLSVGMAVDANILIFERTKEELRLGKSLPAAIEAGFSRAWNSILDSNVSSLITAAILYWFGSSTIRGFALVLIIGVLTSMFTAITVTRTILRVVVRQEGVRKAWLFGVRDDEFLARPTARGRVGEASGRV